MTSFSFFSFPSVSLLSEIKDRGGEGSNREHVVFRHVVTMVNRQPVRERGRREAQPVAFQSNLAHFFSIQGLLSITF